MSENKDIHNEVIINLRRIIRAIDLYSKQLSKEVGLTGPQIIVLKHLAENPYITTGNLAKNINLSMATVTSILDRLEKKEIVMRKRGDKDKRRVHVSLTEKGEKITSASPSLLQEHFIEKFNKLESWEQSMILSSIQRIAKMMEAEDMSASAILTSDTLDSKEVEAKAAETFFDTLHQNDESNENS